MTRQKSFKGRIRARMDKTSESYTTARRQLLAKAGSEPPAEPETQPVANWDDGSTRLVIAFSARGQARSQVALTHERIPDAATADRLKPWWRERVADLKRVLEA